MKLGKAAELVRQGALETPTYDAFAAEHWRRVRTNDPKERLMREIRRRTRWGTRRYLDMEPPQQRATPREEESVRIAS